MADAWSFLPASCPSQQVLDSGRDLASKTKVETIEEDSKPQPDFQTLASADTHVHTNMHTHQNTKSQTASPSCPT